MGVDAAQVEVGRCRALAAADPVTYEPELGAALYTRCHELHRARGPVTATGLALLEEGIALHRRLLRRNPTSLPQLALMLCWLGDAQSRLGMDAKARELMEEGVGLIRRLAHEQRDVYEDQLARALALVSHTLSRTGEHDAAVSAARESVAIWRDRVAERPGPHDTDLVAALHMLCFALTDAGREDETLAPAQESVTIARRLRAGPSGVGSARLLANGLDLQMAALANGGRRQEAVAVAEEAVHSYREAGRNGDRARSLNYLGALHNLIKLQLQLERKREARPYADLAVLECLKRIRDTDDLAELSRVVSEFAGTILDLGMSWQSGALVKRANQRLNPQPRGLGKLIARLRRG